MRLWDVNTEKCLSTLEGHTSWVISVTFSPDGQLVASGSKDQTKMKPHDYEKYAPEYSELGIEGTVYLAFRDIPKLLQKHVNGKKALDYGCGSGRSTRFMKASGFDTVGVDISHDMLKQARLKDKSGEYHHIQSGQIPFEEESFDIVFSSFVLLEVSSLGEMEKILREMKRVLKQDGFIIIVTVPPECYKANFVSLSYDFPENKRPLRSGETITLLIRGTNIILHDYYWTEQDYEQLFNHVGLRITEVLKPLGRDDDPMEWLDEKKIAPLLIYGLNREAACEALEAIPGREEDVLEESEEAE